MKTIFEISRKGAKTGYLPKMDVPRKDCLPDSMLRKDNNLPEINEVELVRHYTTLSKRNFGVDDGFYPLGSCTMKYNPKVNEDMSRLPGFTETHPLSNINSVQGNLELLYNLQNDLLEITGMDSITLQPAAGAHGELTGMMIVKKYFEVNGQERTKIITTDSSHGTNPATATMCGFETITLKSNEKGQADIDALKKELTSDVACIMLTIPNTLGIFEEEIIKITRMCHDNGTLVYMDGANMNAMVGIARPREMGVDILHLNLHKTFSTPHGCGGPGSGPVAVIRELEDFLPIPKIEESNGLYKLNYNSKNSIGRIRAFYGNYGVLVKAYTYIKSLGSSGLRRVAESAVLNANYLKEKLKSHYHLAYDYLCKHEFIIDDSKLPNKVTTKDVAKRLIDYGMHPPTIYFPLIVPGAIMIEPNDTENKATLDMFAEVMIKIKDEAETNPEIVKNAPVTAPVTRLNEVQAARNPCLKCG